MKKLLLVLAVVGTTLFTACNKDNNECDHDFIECDHDFIEHDYSKALVGTWTSLEENGMGEAIQIEENGSFTITGITAGGVRRVLKGTVTAVNNKITLSFDGSDTLEGRLELVEGVSMSIIFLDEFDFRKTYTY